MRLTRDLRGPAGAADRAAGGMVAPGCRTRHGGHRGIAGAGGAGVGGVAGDGGGEGAGAVPGELGAGVAGGVAGDGGGVGAGGVIGAGAGVGAGGAVRAGGCVAPGGAAGIAPGAGATGVAVPLPLPLGLVAPGVAVPTGTVGITTIGWPSGGAAGWASPGAGCPVTGSAIGPVLPCSRAEVSVTPPGSGGGRVGSLGPGAVDSPITGPITRGCAADRAHAAAPPAIASANSVARRAG